MAAEPVSTVINMDLVGGDVALDYANTASQRTDGTPAVERLTGYGDLVTFAVRTGLVSAERAAELAREAAVRPGEAEAVLKDAVRLREAIYRIFAGVAARVPADPADVAVLNAQLVDALRHRIVAPEGTGFTWVWASGGEPLSELLWPIAYSAAELLVHGEPARVKACGNDTCAWLFLDVSRNRSRRWCDMKDCGNRAKARRHYARRKRGAL